MQTQLTQSYTPSLLIDKARQLEPKTREKMYAYQLEMRLQEWGIWYSKSLDNGTGYSNRSITVAALEFSRSTAPYYPFDNTQAEEVHKAFLHLKYIHADWANVLSAEYVRHKLDIEREGNKTRTKKQEARAKKLEMSLGNYKVLLRTAKSFVEARITA